MAIFQHKGSPYWQYKFSLPGAAKPFRGSTKETSRRKAEQYEARVRAEELGKLQGLPINRGARLPSMSLGQAVERFWEEKAQHEKSAKTVIGQLNRLLDYFGENTPLHYITPDQLTAYQTARRKETVMRAGERRPVTNRTINAEVPELMQRLYSRARLWRVDVGEPIEWSALKLEVAAPRVRSLSREEEVRLLRALRLDYRPIVRFTMITGLRRSAVLLRRDQLHLEEGWLEYAKKSKRTNDTGALPVTREMARILRREIEKGGPDQEMVFTYLCRRSRQHRKRGQRYAITYNGLREAMEEAVFKARLENWRLFHDLRHTAATRTLRKSKDLKAVQNMLGHSDIKQTSHYAHAMLDDVRDAMEA